MPGHEGQLPLVVRDLGSALRPADPGAPWADLELPAEHPLPPSLAGELTDVPLTILNEGGTVEVVHGAAAGLGDCPPPPAEVELVVLASAAAMLGRHERLVDAVVAARRRAGHARLLYTPGAAMPHNLALLAYMGVDVVDDVRCLLEGSRDHRLTPELPPVPGPSAPDGPQDADEANRMALRRELSLVRHAIEAGQLRELVEVRVRTEPWQLAALRHLDGRYADLLEARCPVHRDAPLLAVSREAFHRVEVTAWTRRLLDRYRPPESARVLVLLPCSARKPYSASRTHRVILARLREVPNRAAVHEVILTSPMGLVPRELERTYPAAHYDISVTGEWFPEEQERMELLLNHVRLVGGYDAVISHMGRGLPFLEDDPRVLHTRARGEGPLDHGALSALTELVGQAAAQAETADWRGRDLENVTGLARFQLGATAAEALLRGARLKGRRPAWRVAGSDGGQRAMVVPKRGLLSLTLAGGEALASAGTNRVQMDDFDLRGDLFAVGVVDVDEGIRPQGTGGRGVVTRWPP
jgi:archaeosine synthase